MIERSRRLWIGLSWCVAAAGCNGGGAGSDGGTGTSTGMGSGITTLTTGGAGDSEPTAGSDGGTTGMRLDLGEGSVATTETCADADVKFEAQTPTVLLLIDQSGSMTENFGGTDRWDAVYDALLDQDDGLVPDLEDKIRFGMALYTSFDGNEGGECPVITATTPALNNYAAIEASYEAAKPEDETPTGDSIAAVTPTLVMDPSPGNKVIVLATDGEPDTCAEPNPQNGQQASVDAAAAAFAQGVRLYVISVGAEVSDEHLQDVANAGVGVGQGDPNAPFYKANDADALAAAFAEIVEGVRDCKLDVDGKVAEGGEAECVVSVNGEPVPYGTDDGWQLNNPSEIELVGGSCDAIQDGDVAVSIKCACGVVTPVG
ncbi:MAG TPA: vWA domain-containing protein [Nannocystis sp.]|jgi:hypothetical protein